MPKISESFIDDIRAQADIVDVIDAMVPLKKGRRQLHGLLPFSWRENTIIYG